MLDSINLLKTPDLTFGRVLCSATEPTLSGEEAEPAFSVSFPTRGTYVRHIGRHRVVANANSAIFFNSGEIHRVSHPAAMGDVNVFAEFSDDFAEPFLHPITERFPSRAVPLETRSHLSIRILERNVAAGVAGPLEVEETILGLVGDLVEPKTPVSNPGHWANAIVDDAMEYLAVNHSGDATLRTVATIVGSSPHHLSRVFRRATGVTVTEYRTQLRVRSAIDRISQGADDLATLAVDVGFYDHSHLTRTIRRQLGFTPSQIRNQLRPAS